MSSVVRNIQTAAIRERRGISITERFVSMGNRVLIKYPIKSETVVKPNTKPSCPGSFRAAPTSVIGIAILKKNVATMTENDNWLFFKKRRISLLFFFVFNSCDCANVCDYLRDKKILNKKPRALVITEKIVTIATALKIDFILVLKYYIIH